MPRFKMLVSATLPNPDSEQRLGQFVHVAAGTVIPLGDEDAALAESQGTAAPFSEHTGCPECARQDRPCTVECFRAFGGTDEEYPEAMFALEAQKQRARAHREAAELAEPLARDPAPPQAALDLPPVPVVSQEPAPPPPQDAPPATTSKRKPSEAPHQT